MELRSRPTSSASTSAGAFDSDPPDPPDPGVSHPSASSATPSSAHHDAAAVTAQHASGSSNTVHLDAGTYHQMQEDLRRTRGELRAMTAERSRLVSEVQAYTPRVRQLEEDLHSMHTYIQRHQNQRSTPFHDSVRPHSESARPPRTDLSVAEMNKALQLLERTVKKFTGSTTTSIGANAPGPWLLNTLRNLHIAAPNASADQLTTLFGSRLDDAAETWIRGLQGRGLPFLTPPATLAETSVERLRTSQNTSSIVGRFLARFCPYTDTDLIQAALKETVSGKGEFDPNAVLDTIIAHQNTFGQQLSDERIWTLFRETLPQELNAAIIGATYMDYARHAEGYDYRWLCEQASHFLRARAASGLPRSVSQHPVPPQSTAIGSSAHVQPIQRAPFAVGSAASTASLDSTQLLQKLQDLQKEVLRLKGCVMDNVVLPAYNLSTAYPEDRGYIRSDGELQPQYRSYRQDLDTRYSDAANRRVNFAERPASPLPRPSNFRTLPPSSPGSTSRPLHADYPSPTPYAAPPPRSAGRSDLPPPSPPPVYNNPRTSSPSPSPSHQHNTRYRNQGGFQRRQDSAYTYQPLARGINYLSQDDNLPHLEDYSELLPDDASSAHRVAPVQTTVPPQDHDSAIEEEQHATYDKGDPSLAPSIVRHHSPSFTVPFFLPGPKGKLSYRMLVDTGADYTVLSKAVLLAMKVDLDAYVDRTASERYQCFDVNNNPLCALGILRQEIVGTLQADDSTLHSFSIAPSCTAHDGTHSVVVVCDSPIPFPLILGWVHIGFNQLLVDAARIELRRDTFRFPKSHSASRVPPRIASLNPRLAPEPPGLYSAVAIYNLLPLQTTTLPVRISRWPRAARDDVYGDLLTIPDDSFMDRTGVVFTAALLVDVDPYIIVTNTNLYAVDIPMDTLLGHLTLSYRAHVRTITTDHPKITLRKSFGDASLPRIHDSVLPHQRQEIQALLMDYQDIFQNDFSKDAWETTPASISLQPNAKPFRSNPYRLPEAHHDAMKLFIQKFLDAGIIRPSNSPWAAPAFLVPKPNGGLRFVIDYRVLNNYTIRCHWPLPNIEDLLYRLRGSKIFSAFDAHTGFHQMALDDEAQALASFITSFGQYQYTRLPMGLVNAPSMFMRAMAEFSQGLRNILVYVDDITLYNDGPSLEEVFSLHVTLLRRFFERCRLRRLKLNGTKSIVCAPEIKFLGHRITRDGVFPTKEKVEAVQSFLPPTNIKAVRAFLGLVNYYRQWIPNCAALQEPLIELTRKDRPFRWTTACESAFQSLKHSLTNDCVRHFPRPDLPLHLETDSSDYAIAGALTQYGNDPDSGKVLGYYSRTLSEAEQNYAVFEKETLAIVAAISHFRQYLATQRLFYVHTDHRSLTTVLRWKDPPRRIARWLAILSEYSFQTVYKPGIHNLNADALSRLASKRVTPPVTSSLPARIVSRDGMLAEEGKFDRPDGGQLSVISPIRRSSTLPEAPSTESALVTANSTTAQLNDEMIYSLYGRIFYDGNAKLWFRIGDVVYDSTCQKFLGLRLPHSPPGAPLNLSADEWLPIDYFLQNISAVDTPEYLRARDEFPFDTSFRDAVEHEIQHLLSTQAIRAQDINFLPDELGQYHYYRRVYDSAGLWNFQLIIPHRDSVCITQLLRMAHDDRGHFGVRSTFNRLRSHVFWKGMQKDIESYVASCIDCQLKGSARDGVLHDPKLVLRHPLVFRPFQRVSADLTGPLQKTPEGFQYILVMVDHFTKWVITVPLRSKTAAEVGDGIVHHLYLVFGPAEVLLCDNGTELTANRVNSHIFSAFGSYLTNTTGYHPASNGQVERINGIIKTSVAKYLNETNHNDWHRFLPLVTHSINTAVNSTTGFTPFMLVFGRECRTPVDGVIPRLQQPASLSGSQREYLKDLITKFDILHASTVGHMDAKQSLYNKPSVVNRALALMDKPLYVPGDKVLIFTPAVKVSNTRKLSKFWHGPYDVVDTINSTTYAVRTSTSTDVPPEPIHVSRLKPFSQRPAKFASYQRPLLT